VSEEIKGNLFVPADVYSQIIACLEHSGGPQKIGAIKALRAATQSSLKDAKMAIERIQHEKFNANYPHAAREGRRVSVGPVIKRIVVDFGEGEIEVDLEEMQMKALMSMPTIGLDAARDILNLVEALEAYSSGQRIGVL